MFYQSKAVEQLRFELSVFPPFCLFSSPCIDQTCFRQLSIIKQSFVEKSKKKKNKKWTIKQSILNIFIKRTKKHFLKKSFKIFEVAFSKKLAKRMWKKGFLFLSWFSFLAYFQKFVQLNFNMASLLSVGKGKRTMESLTAKDQYSCEFGSSKYFALCGFGGILSCGITHTMVTPLDLVKCRLQVNSPFWLFFWI